MSNEQFRQQIQAIHRYQWINLTAYLEEDRSKALAARFELHLHKLAQPTELIEMVTQLADAHLTQRMIRRTNLRNYSVVEESHT